MIIQASIAGFSGPAITLISSFDDETGVLVVAKQVAFREERIEPHFALVANMDLPSRDMLFDDTMLRDAIRDYFTSKAQNTIDIIEGLMRYLPDNKIEASEVDERGRKYRVSGDVDNGQIAILATVAFAVRSATTSAGIAAMKDHAESYRIISI